MFQCRVGVSHLAGAQWTMDRRNVFSDNGVELTLQPIHCRKYHQSDFQTCILHQDNHFCDQRLNTVISDFIRENTGFLAITLLGAPRGMHHYEILLYN